MPPKPANTHLNPQAVSPRAGHTQVRPPKDRSQAYSGIEPLSPFTSRTQLFQPLPPPLGEPPYHYDVATVWPDIAAAAAKNGHIVFHTVGDTGGIKDPNPQSTVATALKGDLNLPEAQRPSFLFHLGDVVYYNGEYKDYYDQFYEPYDHYNVPIFSIPGNHDGDPVDASQTSLDGWVNYFMTNPPHIDPISHDAPRVTLSQPNVYFTLVSPFVTIVGMYTNVPEYGSIDSVQQQWLTYELANAPLDRALIVALHHPIYSFDDYHSGSPRMASALQTSINASHRVPNLVLTAHVHNYQRIERTLTDGSLMPFLVAGHGGYYHLHGMNATVGTVDPNNGAKLIAGNHVDHGYVTLTVNADTISGTMTTVAAGQSPTTNVDTFSYSARPHTLSASTVISL